MDEPERSTTGRLLGLLSALQSRPDWSGPELAERLGITVRTVRRDVERLRGLGYPVLATTGAAGGYRLGAGGRAMPPLMLDRDEAVAVAVSLRGTAGEMVAGGSDAAISALGKLESLLPPVLRRQVGALDAMTSRLGASTSPVDAELLVTLTRACRDGERVRARYRDGHGRETDRTLDPYRLVQTPRRWYLVAHDRDRDDWRTLRVDRLLDVVPTGHLVRLVDPPDPVPFVQQAISVAPYRHQARVELLAPLETVRPLIPPTTGVLEAIDDERTLFVTGADDLHVVVFHLAALTIDFIIREPEELRAACAEVARRLGRATR